MILQKIFFIIFLIILFISYRNYFSYNDTIHYFNVDISNSEYLVDLLNKKGFTKNPQKILIILAANYLII